MRLVDLIEYLRESDGIMKLSKKLNLDLEPAEGLIYMENSLHFDSEIIILGIEETDDDLVFEKNDTKYFQLFAMDHIVDLINEDLNLNRKENSNVTIAKRLIEYRVNDA